MADSYTSEYNTPQNATATSTGADDQWNLDDAVLVCIDVECHCRNQTFAEHQRGIHRSERRVCEIGIATFDPRKVARAEAGDRGTHTWDSFKATNFAIKEHKHVVGRSHPYWCSVGNANDFEFGNTTWVGKNAVRHSAIQYIRSQTKNRRVIFLFFDTGNDLTWLQGLGINLAQQFPNSEVRDIQKDGVAAQIAHKLRRPQIGASTLVDALGFTVTHAHNGGNDAVWELRAYIAGLTLTAEQRGAVADGVPLPRLDGTAPATMPVQQTTIDDSWY